MQAPGLDLQQTTRYEQLRTEALSLPGGPVSPGLQRLLQEGIAAWMQGGALQTPGERIGEVPLTTPEPPLSHLTHAEVACPGVDGSARESGTGPELRARVADLLAQILLHAEQEVFR